MKTEVARRMLEAARVEATRMEKAVSVAIVDATGTLVLLERVNDAAGFTAVVAEGKACASAFSGRDSGQMEGLAERYPQLATSLTVRAGGRLVLLQGALVLTDESGTIGAIGVSGASAEEDEQIARAGTAALAG